MLIEQPPLIYRLLFPDSYWKIPSKEEKVIYLTFDDGPIPETTPWVLDLLDKYNIKATFFCVGDNVRKHPNIYNEVLNRGHQVGNHTFNHIQALKTKTEDYLRNIELASEYIKSDLFRPPHGHIRRSQLRAIQKKYKIIMWDVVTRDYSKKQTPQKVLENVKKYARNGSIVIFHDSLKAAENMKYALPLAIEWLLEQGYVFKLIESAQSSERAEQIMERAETNLHSLENDTYDLVHEYK